MHDDTVFEDSRWVELAAEQPKGKVKYMSPASIDVARKVLAGFGPRFEQRVQAGVETYRDSEPPASAFQSH